MKLFMFVFTLIVIVSISVRATLWPLKRHYCSDSRECLEGECCQRRRQSRPLCVIQDHYTKNCIYDEGSTWRPSTWNPWTWRPYTSTWGPFTTWRPTDLKPGFCPPRPTYAGCRYDSQCPDQQKCCSEICKEPIYDKK
ncbi:Uncharacterised protein g4288 [Pycnogonum litorale]